MSQIDPLLRPSHGPDPLPQSVESRSCSIPSTSQIDPLLRLSYGPDDVLSLPLSSINTDPIPDHLPLPAIASQHPNLPSTSSESSLASSSSLGIAVSSSSSSSSLLSIPPVDKGLPSQPSVRLVMADPSINARYASQLRPVFIEHVADVHERAEQKRRRDQEALQDKKRMNQRVVVFSFAKNDTDPVVVDIQDGFTYPYFKLTQVVLDDLELASPDDDQLCRAMHYFDPAFDTWVKVKVDSVIELTKPSQKLFFKGMNVMSYSSFDRHFQAAATPSCRVDNPCVSLSQECNYVKCNLTIMKACTLDMLNEQLESMLDEDQGDALPLLSQKCCVRSNQPLLPFQKPRREGSMAACSAPSAK
ncbi:hypothetical protein HD554DRAFT_2179171 [Boletus coccyginus]|nr:hypothetical protein HD554DRAFT_2179171 [Boletus coccyginus]